MASTLPMLAESDAVRKRGLEDGEHHLTSVPKRQRVEE